MHFHVWLRSGRIFTMKAKAFRDRTVAHRWAVSRRVQTDDRLILRCKECPKSVRSRRRVVRWSQVASVLGVSLADLRAAIAAEKGGA